MVFLKEQMTERKNRSKFGKISEPTAFFLSVFSQNGCRVVDDSYPQTGEELDKHLKELKEGIAKGLEALANNSQHSPVVRKKASAFAAKLGDLNGSQIFDLRKNELPELFELLEENGYKVPAKSRQISRLDLSF